MIYRTACARALIAAIAVLGSTAAVLAQTPLSGPPSSAPTAPPPWQNPDLTPQAQPAPPPPAPPLPAAPPSGAPPTNTVSPPPLGTVSPIRGPSRPECREFEQTIMIGGQPQQAYGTACRQQDGTWKIVH
jgi:hypothetical protein